VGRDVPEDPFVELQSYWKKNKDKRPKQKAIVYEANSARYVVEARWNLLN
jgi:hypothetical protein